MTNTNDSVRLGNNLKRLRAEKGLTQADIAKAVDVTCPYLSNIENGKVNPKLSTLAKLAKAVGVKVDELIK